MDNVEPSLVPQWLKGNTFSSNGANSAKGEKQDPIVKPKSTVPEREPVRQERTKRVDVNLNRPTTSDRNNTDRQWKGNQYLGVSGPKPAPRGQASDKATSEDWAVHESSQGDRARPAYSRFPEHRGNGYKGQEAGREIRFKGDASLIRDSEGKPTEVKDHPLRTYQGPQVSFDREFPSLKDAKDGPFYANSIAPYKQNYLSARGSASWSSKLADVPPAVEAGPSQDTAPSVQSQSSQPTPSLQTSWNTVAANVTNSGKGGDLGNGTQFQGPGGAVDKQRLEQLVAKQTKQLIPVVANLASRSKSGKHAPGQKGDAKASGKSGLRVDDAGAPSAALPRRNSAPPEKGASNLKPVAPAPVAPPASMLVIPTAAFNSAVTTGIAPPKGQPVVEEKTKVLGKNRNSFFESLRRKSSTLEHPDDQCPEGMERQLELSMYPVGQSDCLYPDQCAADAFSNNEQLNLLPEPEQAGSEDGKFQVPPEEEAFLKSLGWTAVEDEEDGGLTEEEIAAFKAASQYRSKLGTSKSVSIAAVAMNLNTESLAASYGSEITSSDSDSD